MSLVYWMIYCFSRIVNTVFTCGMSLKYSFVFVKDKDCIQLHFMHSFIFSGTGLVCIKSMEAGRYLKGISHAG
jgi:hypothetical protein